MLKQNYGWVVNIFSRHFGLLQNFVDVEVLSFFDVPQMVNSVADALHSFERVPHLVQLPLQPRHLSRLSQIPSVQFSHCFDLPDEVAHLFLAVGFIRNEGSLFRFAQHLKLFGGSLQYCVLLVDFLLKEGFHFAEFSSQQLFLCFHPLSFFPHQPHRRFVLPPHQLNVEFAFLPRFLHHEERFVQLPSQLSVDFVVLTVLLAEVRWWLFQWCLFLYFRMTQTLSQLLVFSAECVALLLCMFEWASNDFALPR